jgi:short-subunit dehydrogenase
MKDFLVRYGEWGLVAGAAEGLGEAYCMTLAEKGMNLVLVDHQKAAMENLASTLQKSYHIKTKNLYLDLANREASGEMLNAIKGLDCRLLVYNAAYSKVSMFLDQPEDTLERYLDVNCRTLLHSVYGFAGRLINRSTGGIILMSSLAGLWGTNLVAPYSATKAFTLNLAEALYHEFKPHGIDIIACIAGATATPAYLSTNPEYGLIKPQVMLPGKVSDYAVKMIGSKAVCIPGFSNKLSYFLMSRVLSRNASARIMNRTMRRMYRRTLESQGQAT